MSETTGRRDLVGELERVERELAAVEAEIEDVGEETLEAVQTAHRNLHRLIDAYEDRAVGRGREEFAATVNLRRQVRGVMNGVPEDAPGRGGLQSAADALDRRSVLAKHFEWAREDLAGVTDVFEPLERREELVEKRRELRKSASRRVNDLDDEIDEHERLLALSAVDLEAPVDELREPVERYNALVREDVGTFLEAAPARAVFALIERAGNYPLVALSDPPEHLREFLERDPAGEEPIPTLLEYADYSRSKLEHYAADPGQLKRHVATERTYLEGLDPGPFTVEWPPPPAAELRYRLREVRGLLERIADEETIAALRELRRLARRDRYEELRRVAQARAGLDAADRRRIAETDLEAELERLRAERAELRDLLAEE